MSKWLITISCLVAGCLVTAVADPEEQPGEVDIEQRRANRFLDLLKRRPGFGTALDRVSRFHMERGTLDEFIAQLSTVPSSQPDSAVQHLIAGMLQIQYGRGAEAVVTLQDVEQLRTADPVASHALGLALRDGGEIRLAIAALERALQKWPTKPHLKTIYENLAQLHHRAGNRELSLEVWQRLEMEFPDDRAIREDVAAKLQADGQLQPALERWQHLAANATEPERRIQYRLSVADIQLRLGHNDRAQRTLESELNRIHPDSWLGEVIRLKVESVLLSSQGWQGVVEYYRDRLSKYPNDVASVSRLAALLAQQGDFAEAGTLYQQAIESAPSSVRIRNALIELLVVQGKISAAVATGRELLELSDVGTDDYELVGRLILRDSTLKQFQREQQASRVWMRICGNQDDAVTLGYTARLHRRSGLPDRAVKLFHRLTQLDPHNSVWREELGETLYEQGRRDEALREWNLIAEGSRRNTRNLTRQSEILEKAGEFGAALHTMQQACELTPGISDHIRLAQLLRRSGQLDACYTRLKLAKESATSIAEQRIINEAATEAWKQDPALYVRTAKLQKDLAQNSNNAYGWLQLALMCQVDQRVADAIHFVEKATTVDPHSVLAWQAAADICFQAGLLDRAANSSRQLAEVSSQNRMAALQQVVRLEQQLGRTAEALEAARLLVRESPGHADSCRQFADLCFETGRDTEGLESLKQCLLRNPDDHQLSIELADILADQFQTEAASSVLWRSFNVAANLNDRMSLLEALVKLSQETDTFDRIIGRLKTSGSADPVDRSLYVATAIQLSGDPAGARKSLVRATYQFGRDVRILKLLVELAEAEGNLELATQYQRQVTAISATSEDHMRLAKLEFQTGQMSEPELFWVREARSGNDTQAAIRCIDRFLDDGRLEAAKLISERLVVGRPRDWRVLYRLAMIQWRMNRTENAVSTFNRIIALDLPVDHVFVEPQTAATSPGFPVKTAWKRVQPDQPTVLQLQSPLMRRLKQILDSLNWLQLYTGNEPWSQRLSAPIDYGAARSTALGFLWLAMDLQDRVDFLESLTQTFEVDGAGIADWCSIAVMARRSNLVESARLDGLTAALARSDNTEHQLVLAGLLCHGGVFRSPKMQTQVVSHPHKSTMLQEAAESVAVRRPEWLADIGGWSGVYRQLQRDSQIHNCSEIIGRLSVSSNSATLISATDLAVAHGDLNAVSRCIRKTLTLLSHDASIRLSLESRLPQLSSMAAHLLAAENWNPVRQLVDILLEIHATRYAPLQNIGSNGDSVNFPGYRLVTVRSTNAAAFQHLKSSDSLELDDSGWKPPFKLRHRSSWNSGNVRFVVQNGGDFGGHLDPCLSSLLVRLIHHDNPHGHAERLVNYLSSISREDSVPVWISSSMILAGYFAAQKSVDDAILALVPVVKYLPHDVGIRLNLADYLHAAGAHRDALKLLDAMPVPRNRQLILLTEMFALRLCLALSDQNRAQLAASRLFALKLDRDDVDVITEKLLDLQLPDTAQRFRSRVVQSVAGRTEQLHQLMQNYSDAGNRSAAVRIARQFILQPSITLNGASVVHSVQARRAALQILAGSDAIMPIILQLRRKLNDDSASFHQHHVLVELLKADGQEIEAEEAAQPLRQSLVEDPNAALQLARQLERQGRLESACDVCRYLLEADTQLFHRDYYRFIRLFERNGGLEELADLILAADLRRDVSGHWGVQQLTERLLPHDEVRGLKLFAAAWRVWPDSRAALLANVSHDAIWLLPEVFDYFSTKILPTANRLVDPWFGVAEHLQVRGRGVVTGTLSRMLQVPVVAGRAEEFLNEIREALVVQPDWHAGWIYVALLEANLGRTDDALAHFSEILQHHLATMPPMVAWVTACELVKVNATPLDGVIVRLLEQLSVVQKSGTVLLKSGTGWHAAPDYLLTTHFMVMEDAVSAKAVVERLLTRIYIEENGLAEQSGRDANGTKGGIDSETQTAFNDLAQRLQSHLPEEAEHLRELGRSEPQVSSVGQTGDSVPHTGKTDKVIQVIRECLLQQRP